MVHLYRTSPPGPDEVTAANVVTSTADAVGVLAGPAIAGLILIGGEPGHVYLTLAAGVLVAALLVFRVRGQSPPPRLSVSTSSQMLAGLAAVRGDRDLRAIVAIAASSFVLGGAVDVLVVILAVEILGWGDAGAGALAAAAGLGALIGAMAATAIVGRRLSRALLFAVVVAALPLTLLGWLSIAALVLLFVTAAGLQWIELITRTLLQRAAPATTLARVLGVHEGLAAGSVAVGSLLVSALFTSVQPAITFGVLGLLLPIVCVVSWTRIKELERTTPLRLGEIDLLRRVPMFGLSPLVLETLAADLVPEEVDGGMTVVREGDPGDSLYIIAERNFIVEKSGKQLARLGPADVFGEIAVLYDMARTATVRSLGLGRVYILGGQQFLSAMGATGDAKLAARGLADRRLDEQGSGR